MDGKDRLIVALDVPSHDEALALVDTLDNVSFFKVGLELLLADGGLVPLLERLEARRPAGGGGGVFLDLKLSGDIGNTITGLVKQARRLGVRFMTLVESVPAAITVQAIQSARAARAPHATPELLMVPCLSSLDAADLRAAGIDESLDSYVVRRGKAMVDAGCDGLIVSGSAIRACRLALGAAVPLVSPGIRPAWAAANDHKRYTTPGEAIRLGSDYLVVGQPIRQASNPRDAAQRIIDEIDDALLERDIHPPVPPPGAPDGDRLRT